MEEEEDHVLRQWTDENGFSTCGPLHICLVDSNGISMV